MPFISPGWRHLWQTQHHRRNQLPMMEGVQGRGGMHVFLVHGTAWVGKDQRVLVHQIKARLEPATGIEPATCGLRIRLGGLLKSLMT